MAHLSAGLGLYDTWVALFGSVQVVFAVDFSETGQLLHQGYVRTYSCGNLPCAGAITARPRGQFMWAYSHPLTGPDAEPQGRRVPCPAGENRRPGLRHKGRINDAGNGGRPDEFGPGWHAWRGARIRGAIHRRAACGGRRGGTRGRPGRHHRHGVAGLDRLGIPAHRDRRDRDRGGPAAARRRPARSGAASARSAWDLPGSGRPVSAGRRAYCSAPGHSPATSPRAPSACPAIPVTSATGATGWARCRCLSRPRW